MEMLLCKQTIRIGNQDVLQLLGLYEQVIPTDGLRNAALEHASRNIATGSLCGTGVIT